jgi:Mechanosensitive ion channel, conserved TM helix
MWQEVRQALNQSTAGYITRLAGLLPGFVAFVVALLVSLLLAWIAGFIVRRLLIGVKFDDRVAHWGIASMADWSPGHSPTFLASALVRGAIVVTGFLIGITAFDSEMTSSMARSVIAYIPNILGAALILFVGTIVARFVARSVLIGAVNLNLGYARLLSAGTRWLVMVVTVAMALVHLRIAVGIVELAFGILFGGIVLALALAVGLGSRDLVSKSLDRDAIKSPPESVEEPFRHL